MAAAPRSPRPARAQPTAAQARAVPAPDVAGAPDVHEDLPPAPDRVDWLPLIQAALGPNSSLKSPLPRLLIQLAEQLELTRRSAAGSHDAHVGLNTDLPDMVGSFADRFREQDRKITDLQMSVEALTVRAERAERATA